MLGEETIDGGLQFDDGSEHATLEPLFGEFGEEALDGVRQEAEVGVKWKVKRGWPSHSITLGWLWAA